MGAKSAGMGTQETTSKQACSYVFISKAELLLHFLY